MAVLFENLDEGRVLLCENLIKNRYSYLITLSVQKVSEWNSCLSIGSNTRTAPS